MVAEKPDFMDCEAYLAGDVTPALAAAALTGHGYEVEVSGHAAALTSLRARRPEGDDDEWTSIAVHRFDAGTGETLAVADRFGEGPKMLSCLARQFGGRWREACDRDVPFRLEKASPSVDFTPREVFKDKISKLFSPHAAELIVAAMDDRPEIGEDLAETLRDYAASLQGPRP